MTRPPLPQVADVVEVYPLNVWAADVEQALTVLDEAERLRFARYRDRWKAHEFAATRAFLRRLLSDRAGGSPRDVPLDSICRRCGRHYGPPRLVPPADPVAISVTHSNGWALVALGPPAAPIGIALEHP
ncbi:4'-phosphopantetheinyl transferase family protein [Streptomyces argenteolus]|uniref:4'-phosphopantetheinyl transferase family protein n=1 Tax=Streptomyces argenteolus TaxID=67274 RepID=A0ABW6XEG3_9ACTN